MQAFGDLEDQDRDRVCSLVIMIGNNTGTRKKIFEDQPFFFFWSFFQFFLAHTRFFKLQSVAQPKGRGFFSQVIQKI